MASRSLSNANHLPSWACRARLLPSRRGRFARTVLLHFPVIAASSATVRPSSSSSAVQISCADLGSAPHRKQSFCADLNRAPFVNPLVTHPPTGVLGIGL